jgi:hypothetical protein
VAANGLDRILAMSFDRLEEDILQCKVDMYVRNRPDGDTLKREYVKNVPSGVSVV